MRSCHALLLAAIASGLLAALVARPAAAAAPPHQQPPAVHADSADAAFVRSLPLTERPARAPGATTLVVLLTGDGGWASIDRQIARRLNERGIAVVGLDARAYLSRPRTPDGAASDLARVVRYYLRAWDLERVALVGYSRGADMAPFIANRLPDDERQRLALVAMLGLGERANFHFHWLDLLRDTARPSDLPVLPELERLRGTPMLCVYGTRERDSLCRAAPAGLVDRVARRGAHHLGGDYPALADTIAAELR